MFFLKKIFFIFLVTVLLSNHALSQKDVKTGVRPEVISLPSGPGSIEGLGESFEPLLNTGQFTYQIPIKVQPGRAGFSPSISLFYNSGKGNGKLGIGWNINEIFVKKQTDKGLPRYDDPSDPDTFINENGEELVRVEGYSTDTLQVYRIKNESSFRKYEYHMDEDFWICTNRSGNKYYLGCRMNQEDVSARIIHPDNSLTYAWHIAEAVDTNNNIIHYSYFREQNQIYCDGIEYGAIESNNPEAIHKINLDWESRPDSISDYRPTFRLITSRRLKEISELTAGKLVRIYKVEYEREISVSLLKKVTLFGSDETTSMPATIFGYTINQLPGNPGMTALPDLAGTRILLENESYDANPDAAEILDFDSDALPDFYVSDYPGSDPFEYDVSYYNMGNGNFVRESHTHNKSLGLPVQSNKSFIRDLNGDATTDLVAQKGSNPEDFVYRMNNCGDWSTDEIIVRFPQGETPESVFLNANVRTLDLNFDKKIDTIRSYSTTDISGDGVAFAAYLNNGDGTFNSIDKTMNTILKGLPSSATFEGADKRLIFADMNGDRLLDLVLLRDRLNGGIIFWPSEGFGHFDDSSNGYLMSGGPDDSWDYDDLKNMDMRDLNGDGLEDLYIIQGAQFFYWLNINGHQFDDQSTIAIKNNKGDPLQYNSDNATYRILDIDGDGMNDILFYARNSGSEEIPVGFHYMKIFSSLKPNLLNHVFDGLGKTTTIEYSSSVEDMVRDKTGGDPWPSRIPFPVTVVRSIKEFDGIKNYCMEFAYHDGHYDGDEKEFRGFSSTEVFNQGDESEGIPTLVTEYEFHTGDTEEALKGKTISLKTCTLDDQIFHNDTYDWNVRNLINNSKYTDDPRNVVFAYLRSENRNIMEKNSDEPVRLEKQYRYDNYGNLIVYANYGRVENEDRSAWDDERIIFTKYSSQYPDGKSNWILDRLIEQEIRHEDGIKLSDDGFDLIPGSKIYSLQRRYYDDESFSTSNTGYITSGNLTMILDWADPSEEQSYVKKVRKKYDQFGNPVLLIDPLGAAPGGNIDFSKGHCREILYDRNFNVFPVQEKIFTANPDSTTSISLLSISADYDPGLGVVTATTNFNGYKTRYRYDPLGRLIKTVKPGDSSKYPTTEIEYILRNKVKKDHYINWIETRKRESADKEGTLDSRTYFDSLGRKFMTRSEGEEPNQVVVEDVIQFNKRKLPWKKSLPYFDNGIDGTIAYREPKYDTPFLEYKYDALGRETIVFQPLHSGASSRKFKQTIYQPLKKIIHDEEQTDNVETDGDPFSPHYGCGVSYIEDGLQKEQNNPRIRYVTELVKINDDGTPGDTFTSWTTSYEFDLSDNFKGYTDAQDNQKFIEYDSLNRIYFMNDPDRGYIWYAYDDAGNLIRTRDAKGQEIAYAYDGANRLLAEYYITEIEKSGNYLQPGERWKKPGCHPDRAPDVSYHYDFSAGEVYFDDFDHYIIRNISNILLENNNYVTSYDLNNDGILDVSDIITFNNSLASDQSNKLTAKNTQGFLSWVEDLSGREHLSYDSRNRVSWGIKQIKKTDRAGQGSYYYGYEYDSMDRPIKLYYPDLSHIEYNYNSRGLLDSVPNVIKRFDYNPAGKKSRLYLECGVVSSYQYDLRQRLNHLRSIRSNDGVHLQDLKYKYDGVSNIVSIIDERSFADLEDIGDELKIKPLEARRFCSTQSFFYDSLYRLIETSNPDVYGSIAYSYDRIGNMIQKNASNLIDHDPDMDPGKMTVGGDSGSFNRIGRNPGDPPGPHALTSTEKGPHGPLHFEYDDNGNMIFDRGMFLRWDCKDRLNELTSNTVTANYLYDYLNNRVRKNIETPKGNSETLYINDMAEFNNDKLIKYVIIDSKLFCKSTIVSPKSYVLVPTRFFLNDHLGSTTFQLSENSTVLEQLTNYPFGKTRFKQCNVTNSTKFGFTGNERDMESNYIYFGKRYYSPLTGRFISTDPYFCFINKIEKEIKSIITNPGNLNLYSYALNSPVIFIDIDGLYIIGVGARANLKQAGFTLFEAECRLAYNTKSKSLISESHIVLDGMKYKTNLTSGDFTIGTQSSEKELVNVELGVLKLNVAVSGEINTHGGEMSLRVSGTIGMYNLAGSITIDQESLQDFIESGNINDLIKANPRFNLIGGVGQGAGINDLIKAKMEAFISIEATAEEFYKDSQKMINWLNKNFGPLDN